AGVRVGWAAAHPGLLDVLKRVREPFGVTGLAFMGAAAALDDTEFYEHSRKLFLTERREFCRFLDEQKIPYVPSQGNFVLMPLGDASASLASEFAKAGIIVRRLTFKGVGMLRVSIGLPEENARMKEALQKFAALR
ncbi:MAG: aminotransferase class I/II-fold pyridoxal phosphate-dependent enzyme, partial [Synergistaceae bacterium]|nr:aminotransferase class I/II-fold pyridoxal phosphate-dependent enzyme [Synergistaceae bacterium]